MCAHQDDCERTFDAPVVSVSFGCAAIFLLGADRRDAAEPPVAIWVRSGDAMLLGGGACGARLRFHAMPRVVPGTCPIRPAGAAATPGAAAPAVAGAPEADKARTRARGAGSAEASAVQGRAHAGAAEAGSKRKACVLGLPRGGASAPVADLPSGGACAGALRTPAGKCEGGAGELVGAGRSHERATAAGMTDQAGEDDALLREYLQFHRININVRQVDL
eukprot:g4562.t1